MPLVEGSATAVLSAKPHRRAAFHQAGKSQRFRHAVIHGALSIAHLGALFQQFADLRMNVKIGGITGKPLGQASQLFGRNSGFHFVLRLVTPALIFVPVVGQSPHHRLLANVTGALLRCFKLCFDRICARSRILNSGIFGINLPQWRMLFDRLIEQRLRDGRIIDLAVTMTPVSNEIDNNIAAELVAILERHAAHANDCIHVFGIDMKNWNILPAGQLCRKARRMQLAWNGSESD